jgi:PAS domain S-box-containing protein
MLTPRWFADLRIRYKLFLTYSAVLLLAFGAGTLVLDTYVRQTVNDHTEGELKRSTTMVINMVRSAAAVSIKNHLRASAENNREIVDYYYRQSASGRLSESEAKEAARSILLNQSIGTTGYLFAWDVLKAPEEVILAVHPKIQGQDVSDVDFVQMGIKLKSGYMEYRWRNPGEDRDREKAMYLAYFEPWQWIIAATSYKDEFLQLINVSDFRDQILSVKLGRTGYFYVIDSFGNLIIHPKIEGNAYDFTDEAGHSFVQEMCASKTGKLSYTWKNPGEDSYRSKLVIFDYIPEYDWIVASSGYVDEFEAPLFSVRGIVLLSTGLTVLLVLVTSFMVGSFINQPLRKLVDAFEKDPTNLSTRLPVVSMDEIGRLALHFNRYMDSLEQESTERQAAEKALREEAVRRRILIEQSRDGIVVLHQNGKVYECNQSFADMLGYSIEEVQRLHVWDWDIRWTRKELEENLHRLDAAGVHVESRHRRKDGCCYDVEISINVALFAGQNLIFCVHRDITQRKQAEEVLRESEEKFAKAFNHAPLLMTLSDLEDGTYLEVNDKFMQVSGFSREEAVGRTSIELGWISAEDRKLLIEALQTQGRIEGLELTLLAKDKRQVHCVYYGEVITMGGRARLLSIAQDITERKHMEDALKESEERFRSVVDNVGIGISLISPNMEILALNSKMRSWFPNIDVAGKPICYQTFNDPPRQGTCSYCPTCRTFRDGVVHESITETPAGAEVRHYRVVSSPIRGRDGTIVSAVEMVEDITERTRMEQALEKRIIALTRPLDTADTIEFEDLFNLDEIQKLQDQFARATGVASIITHADGTPITKPSSFCRLCETIIRRTEKGLMNCYYSDSVIGGHSPEGPIIQPCLSGGLWDAGASITVGGRHVANWLIGQVRDETQEEVKMRAYAREIGADEKAFVEAFHKVPSMSRDQFQKVAQALFTLAGQLSSMAYQNVQQARFITESKRAEEAKGKLEDQLLHAQKLESVGRLAGGVAHDFNNMLGVILGHCDMAMLQMTHENPLFQDFVEIQKAANRSADLTRQLLAFARRQTVSPKVLDLNDAIAGMLKMLSRLIGEDIDLVWRPGHGLWKVKVDPSQIDQVLANLAVNARDAITGVGSITLATENVSMGALDFPSAPEFVAGDYVLLTVSDTGEGIANDTLDHIFEPFFTTKGVGRGTGLGLATVYGIVKQNNGFISVDSRPGMGATFRIYLPRLEAESVSSTVEEVTRRSEGGRETILLVEDDESMLGLSKRMLEGLGYTVLAANNPKEAIGLVEQRAEDIEMLVTDVVMPDMSGRELATRIHEIRPDLKCLYISGYTADMIAHRGVLEESVHFLHKPFGRNDLARKIREVLQQG